MKKFYDIIVIGGGHAGCEAANAAAKIGASVCLITNKIENIGEMSCNPSIGGVAKGVIVKEIDALDGLMGKVIDEAGIHFKTLNKSKGPAVWGPRAQADRILYKKSMQKYIANNKNLIVCEDEVIDLIIDNYKITGVISKKNKFHCNSVILTTGTFLNGVIHIGNNQKKGGRFAENSSITLAEKIKSLGLPIGRLKTGTPPRLDKDSIKWSILEKQEGDVPPCPFSFMNEQVKLDQINCYITYTNKLTHEIIQNNIHLSPIYSGAISSSGPRYCPSIEDKIVRFSDKERHQIFLEVESLNTNLVYPNGISTAFPESVQKEIVHSILGLENAKILRYGYAIEYDYLDPKQLNENLESKIVKGLFLAGQINGTTGYEEAAGQGIIAGINAALSMNNQEFILDRSESYIGVMINDLITKGISEPYRMMTSRAEYRIMLRPDNADLRLTEKAIKKGIISEKRKKVFLKQKDKMQEIKKYLSEIRLEEKDFNAIGINDIKFKEKKKLLSIMAIQNFNLNSLFKLNNIQLQKSDKVCLEKIQIDQIYKNYEKRMKKDVKILQENKKVILPKNVDFDKIKSLSNEVRFKLKEFKPKTLADLKRIQGITPAAIIEIQLSLNLK